MKILLKINLELIFILNPINELIFKLKKIVLYKYNYRNVLGNVVPDSVFVFV